MSNLMMNETKLTDFSTILLGSYYIHSKLKTAFYDLKAHLLAFLPLVSAANENYDPLPLTILEKIELFISTKDFID